MSRTRLIRPSFFTDEVMAHLSDRTRLVYAGLWGLADDAGYFDRRPAEIALALFGYEAPAVRLRRTEKSLAELAAAERIRWLECGDHGFIPTLPTHGVVKGGNHAYFVKEHHERVCLLTLFRRGEAGYGKRKTAEVRDVARTGHVSESVLESESVLGSESSRGRARDLKEASEEAGGFVARLAARDKTP